MVDSPGDNLLAEFGSAVDAVECAVQNQEEIKKENDEFPESLCGGDNPPALDPETWLY